MSADPWLTPKMLQNSRTERLVFGALFLPSGAALIVYVVSGFSLLAGLILAVIAVLVLGLHQWHRASTPAREGFKAALRVGLVAALVATAAYDLSRYVLVRSTPLTFWPFEAFAVFGQALLATTSQSVWVGALGFAFHVMNGVGFGIAYTVAVARPSVLSGVLWALFLEVLMVTIYPGWLDVRVMDEFLGVSMVGHLVYGGVLGGMARFLIRRRDRGINQ